MHHETIVLNRAGQTDATIAAADKAIAADPSRPIPYYLKGQALISKATVDPKTQKIVAPPGMRGLQQVSRARPKRAHGAEAKSILAEIARRLTLNTMPRSTKPGWN